MKFCEKSKLIYGNKSMQEEFLLVKFVDREEFEPAVKFIDYIVQVDKAGEGVFESNNEIEEIIRKRKRNEEVLGTKSKKLREAQLKQMEKMNQDLIKQKELELKKLAQTLENPGVRPEKSSKKSESWLSRVFSW